MNPILPQLLDLGVPEKLELVEALWESIVATPEELPVADWQKDELDARKATYLENPDSAIPWDEARERLHRGGD